MSFSHGSPLSLGFLRRSFLRKPVHRVPELLHYVLELPREGPGLREVEDAQGLEFPGEGRLPVVPSTGRAVSIRPSQDGLLVGSLFSLKMVGVWAGTSAAAQTSRM